MKILTVLLLASLPACAQFYTLSTNLTATNDIAASATLTYAGTNYLDMTRHRAAGINAKLSGSNTNTNSVSFSFIASADGTNWETLPRFTLTMTSYGTNLSTITTNLDDPPLGYLRPFQIINACTNSLTNVTVYGQLKDFPRN